jgi:hypothetical protein
MCSASRRRSSCPSLRAALLGGALALGAAGFAQGKGNGVEALFVSGGMVDARPGEIVNTGVRVTNHTDAEEEFVESLDLPAGWVSVIAPSSFALRPGESIARIVSLAVPRSAPAGPHEISYSVAAQRDPAIRDSHQVTLGVIAVTGLEVLLIEAPASVLAGEAYTARFQVVNRGNSPVEVRAEALSSSDFPARVEPAEASLAPGQALDVTVMVTTKRDVAARLRHSLQLSVRSGAGEPTAGSALVDVIPRVNVKFDPRHRIPARLTVSAMGGGSGMGAQIELSGAGTLAEDGKREVEFLLRGPDTQEAGLFGKRDEMRFGFADERLAVRVGDQAYEQSRLTAAGMYGRGGEVTWRPNETFEVGVHHAADRWGDRDLRQIGAHADARWGDWGHLRLNHLQRSQSDPAAADGIDDALTSLEAELEPRDDLHLAAEFARNTRHGQARTTDHAYRVEVDGDWQQRAYYSLSKVYAGPDYYGAYRDCDYTQAALSLPLSERIQLHGAWNRLRLNLDGRSDGRGGTDEQLFRGGAKYRWSKDFSTSVDFEDLTYHDPVPPSDFDRREQAVRLGLVSSGVRLSLRADLAFGTQRDHLLDAARSVTYYGLYAAYRFGPDRLISVYGAGGGRGPEGARLLVPGGNLGFSALWGIGERLRLQTSYTAYRSGDLGAQLDLQAMYGEPEETNWSLRARLGGGAGQAFLLSWSRPLELPGARKTSVGGLHGRIVDAEGEGAPGVPDVILSLGELTAATDAHGRFTFANVPPGSYPLLVDSASIGLNRVPNQPVPIAVEVQPGRAATAEIAVVTAGQVSGRVLLIPETTGTEEGFVSGAPGAVQTPGEPTGLAGLLVELTRDGEVHRRVTNARGEFVFDRLRPGAYQFRAYPQNLPAFHLIEEPERPLDVAAGATTPVEVRAIPQVRRIRMIDTESEPSTIRVPEAGTPAPAEPPARTPETRVPSPGDVREGAAGDSAEVPRRVISLQDVLRGATVTAR